MRIHSPDNNVTTSFQNIRDAPDTDFAVYPADPDNPKDGYRALLKIFTNTPKIFHSAKMLTKTFIFVGPGTPFKINIGILRKDMSPPHLQLPE